MTPKKRILIVLQAVFFIKDFLTKTVYSILIGVSAQTLYRLGQECLLSNIKLATPVLNHRRKVK